jgi:hypothetical protein
MRRKYIVQAWHQPAGPGLGWHPCADDKAERFFIFDRMGQREMREFKTRREACAFADQLEKENPQ